MKIGNPDETRAWYCKTCGVRFETTPEALEEITFEALTAFMHYHVALRGDDHEISTWTGPPGVPVVELTNADMRGAEGWWIGFQQGQRSACATLKKHIDDYIRSLS